MGLDFENIFGQRPIDPEERKGLKIKTISNLEELNEFEQFNIEKAMEWIYKKNFATEQILSDEFIKNVHKKMFGIVWKWAGKYRLTNKNIGVDKFQIPTKLKNLLDDCSFWVKNQVFPEEEICIRFKHRLVSIHPFPNGNGRHSRLMADILIEKSFHKKPFTWGRKSISHENDIRNSYLQCLKNADAGDYKSLVLFARS